MPEDTKRDPQGPPKDVSASELWLALTTMPVPHQIVPFPVKDPIYGKSVADVAIVPLSPEELMICRKVAGEWATKMTGEKPKNGEETPAYFAIMAAEAAVQILWRALRDPNDKTLQKPAIPTAALLRQKPFTDDIHAVLMRMYTRACVVCGPIVATMTDEEREAWLDALEEGGSSFFFDLLSSGMKDELLTHLVALRKRSKMGNGSPGQPLDASTKDTPPKSPSEPPPPLPESELPPLVSADELPTQ